MSELTKIVLTAILTIAGGVIVYALGHLSVALIVEPIHRLRGLIGEIAYSLVFYASVYGNPGSVKPETMDEAGEMLRRQASELRARQHSIPFYSIWVVMKLVPGKKNIQEASAELIGLSNSVHGGPGVSPTGNIEKAIKIQQFLGIEISKRKKKQ